MNISPLSLTGSELQPLKDFYQKTSNRHENLKLFFRIDTSSASYYRRAVFVLRFFLGLDGPYNPFPMSERRQIIFFSFSYENTIFLI